MLAANASEGMRLKRAERRDSFHDGRNVGISAIHQTTVLLELLLRV